MKSVRAAWLLAICSAAVLAEGGQPSETVKAAQDQITIPEHVSLRVGNTVEITVSFSQPITADDVKWSEDPSVEVVGSRTQGNVVITVLKATKFSANPAELTVAIRGVSKKITVNVETTVKRDDFPSSVSGDTLSLSQDHPNRIRLNLPENITLPVGALTVEMDNPIVVATIKNTTITLVGREPGLTRLTFKSNEQSIKALDITVDESPDHIQVEKSLISLTEDYELDLDTLRVKVIGKSNGDLTSKMKPTYGTDNTELAEVVNNKLKAKRAPTHGEQRPNLVISAGDLTPIKIPIQIEPGIASIDFSSPPNVVPVGGTFPLGVVVKNTQQAPVAPEIEWSVSPEDQEFIRVVGQQGLMATIQGIKPTPGVQITARVKDKPSIERTITVVVRDLTPSGYSLLHIRLDLLDSQVTKDLFGKKAADEFYIAKVRLFNDLKNANDQYGDSILVYSESLELRVQLQVRDESGQWRDLRINAAGQDSEFHELFGNADDSLTPEQQKQCRDNPQPHFVARYRPYTFDIIANTHDRRDERTARSRILLVANGLSSMASFVTAIAVPGPSSDLPLGLDKFRNLLIPSFEKLFPSLKEVQRQNIITMVMKPLEEIPSGSDITRILFIPRGKFSGMIAGKVFRIGAVSTTGACAQVGIIKKTAPLLP